MHEWPSLKPCTLRLGWDFLAGKNLHALSYIIAGRIKLVPVWLHWEVKFVPGFSWSWPHMPFSFFLILICILLLLLFRFSVLSESLQPHGLQHIRLPYPSPSPRACSNSCPLSYWCHPVKASSAIPFSSCPQSFPASGSFPMSQFFISGGQSIRASALVSVLPMNNQDWFLLGLIGLMSLLSKGLSRVFSRTKVQRHQFGAQPSLWSKSHIHTWLLENHSFDYMDLCWQCNVSIFNTLSRLAIAFLPRSKCLLISRLRSPSIVILEPRKIKSLSVSIVSPSISHEVMGLEAMVFIC